MTEIETKNPNGGGIQIRMANEKDAQSIILLMQLQHGALNPHRWMYHKEKLQKEIRAQHLQAILAVDAFDKPLGMICAGREEGFERGLLFYLLTVRPEARGVNLGLRMQQEFDRNISFSGYHCAYMQCLTVDTISQKNVSKLGYHPTGLIGERYLFDENAAHLKEIRLPQRRSHMMMVKALKNDSISCFPLPRPYGDFIRDTYEKLGIKIIEVALGPQTKRQHKGPAILPFYYPEHRYKDYLVYEIQKDFPLQVEAMVSDADYESVNVFLNLNQVHIKEACCILEEKGGLFTGLLPLAGQYEYMIFHFSKTKVAWLEQIQVLDCFSESRLYQEMMKRVEDENRKGRESHV